MKENMKYLLYAFILILLGTTSAVIEVQYLRGVQRLNDSNYYDYYFTCNAQGNMMQWEVNGVISDPFTGDSVSAVKTQAASNFSYVATLLSSNQASMGHVFDSVLIVSSQGIYDFEAVCRNESSSAMATNTNSMQDVENESKIDSVFLQYLLSFTIATNDNSKQTSLFICGTDNSFMTWRINNSDSMSISFTEGDSFGDVRAFLQDGNSIIMHQGILLGMEPFMLVSVIFVVDSFQLTVTCGYSQNRVNLTIEQASTSSESTVPSTTSVMTVPLTTSMEAKLPETSTITGDTTTATASNGEAISTESAYRINLAVAVSIPIILGALIACIIFIVLLCWFKGTKKCSLQYQDVEKNTDTSAEEINEEIDEGTDVSAEEIKEEIDEGIDVQQNERPLTTLSLVEFKGKNNKLEGFDYEAYCRDVEFIITIVRDDVLNAAATFISAPEEGTKNITKIDQNVFVGKIGDHPVGLIKHIRERNCVEFIKNIVVQYFPNAKYLVSMGLCYTFDCKVANMGDVLISDKIIVYSEEGEEDVTIIKKEECMTHKIKSIFDPTESDDTGLQVTSSRKSRLIKGTIDSCLCIEHSRYLDHIAGPEKACGVEKVAGLLTSLQIDGNTEEDETIQKCSVIAIKGVFGYSDGKEDKNWIFMANQAVLHYIAAKISTYDKKPLNNLRLDKFEGKSSMQKDFDYEAYCGKVEYVITIVREDVLYAAATYFSAPEENSKNITKIDQDVYVGKIGVHPVGLIKHVRDRSCVDFVKKSIVKYFPNSKYLVSMGLCYTLDYKLANMGDVIISNEIFIYREDQVENELTITKCTVIMTNEIKSIFDPTEDDDTGLQVTKSRKSRLIKGNMGSCLSIEESKNLKCLDEIKNAYGADKVAGIFESLQRNGIMMQDRINKKMAIIAIKAVFGYSNGEEERDWIFMASQAVLHYVTTKICACDKTPLKVYTVQENKCKNKEIGFDYEAYCGRVEFIITIVRDDVLNAAATFISAAEENTENITKINQDVYVGRIGDHAIGFIKHVRESKCVEFVKETIVQYFPNAKYLVSMGLCYTFDRKVANMGDVLISDKIIVYREEEEETTVTIKKSEVYMTNEIKTIFDSAEDDDTGLQVTLSRKSRFIKGTIDSCLCIENKRYLEHIARPKQACGVEKVAGLFASLSSDGIKMQDGNTKNISVIAIKAVFGYSNGEEEKDWIFMAGQAVLDYIVIKISNHDITSL